MRKGSGILALIGELIPCGMSQHMRMWGSLAASPVRLTIRRNQAVVTGVPASVVKTEGLEPCRGHKARQADCLAGVWAHHAEEKWRFIEPGDVEAAMQTASAIGDDRLQRRSQGYVVPDAFTHGSSEQRTRWFMTGLRSGQVASCNTFETGQL